VGARPLPADMLSTPARPTGDIYRNMDVSIHKGDLKNHHGVVLGSRGVDNVIVDVHITSQAIPTVVPFPLDHVRERWQGRISLIIRIHS
jgi:hypothetical protein